MKPTKNIHMIFKNLKRSFCDSICTVIISRDVAEMDQTNLLENMVKFNNECRPR